MNRPSPGEVDDAVRAVLAGLAVRNAPAGSPSEVFPERLLALRHAEGLPRGTDLVTVAPGTVVTPLAREHLKRRGIALRLGLGAGAGAGAGEASRERAGVWGFALGLAPDSGLGLALRRAWLAGPEAWLEVGTDAGSAAAWVAGSPERGALLLTPEASVAVWLACQVDRVRAATAVDPAGVARAARHLGMNLLVVEPAGLTIHLARAMATTFRQLGAPAVPEAFRSWDHADRRGDRAGHDLAAPPEFARGPVHPRPADAPVRLDRGLTGAGRGGGRV